MTIVLIAAGVVMAILGAVGLILLGFVIGREAGRKEGMGLGER